jgi:hypothetical protein
MSRQPFKYEGFKVGDLLRCQDFPARPERGDCYVEGPVVEVNVAGTSGFPWAHYVITCTNDVWKGAKVGQGSRVGDRMIVPMESASDWDGRVRVIGG